MIGICGISGIGKTTLAKAVYNSIHTHFGGSCFCEDVKEVTKRQGIIQVQKHLINTILKTEDLKISCVGEGSIVIKQRMACKLILLVLDDVDHQDQLKALAGSASWFCPGSLIIFTGKDKQLLRSHRVDEIHDMDFLDEDQSLKLFSFYAFEEKHPSTGFQELADKAVKYVQGHPLALIVLGCFLYGKTVGQWVSELDKLKLHPNEEIQRVLRLSYDGLNFQQQNSLLDIACLFIGENSEFVASILDGCNFFADTNMQVLVDKSLIMIRSDMSLQMHDLIHAMAREIIHEESIMTGKQRRLWNSSEVYNVLSENKVPITEAVEVLVLSLEKFSQKVHIDANDFAHMKKLRILKIYQEEKLYEQKLELEDHNVIFSGNLYYLSNELSLFYWHGYPFNFPGSLSQLSHLYTLTLNGCKKLEVLPELPPSLDYIYACDCSSLREVSGSSKNPFKYNCFRNCPKLFKNVTIDSEGSISNTQCHDSSITSRGFDHQLSAFLGYLGIQTNRCEFFRSPESAFDSLGIIYHGNSMLEWFTNRSTENHVKVELPSDWCYDKFRGYGTCVVFKVKKPHTSISYSVKNFDGAFLTLKYSSTELNNDESYMIWLDYMSGTREWKEAKNFVTFCFEENNEDVEVKEFGVRLICDGDLQQDVTNLSMFQDLPTLSQHGGAMSYNGRFGYSSWSW
ncbi:NB-ARC domains-containing protein [Artemisia annua]|uniref:ADP-ribosyl cyclase/cyclic ADP-ribose hydrolase n=1 Tax=Artemisia annua TaxID=35608 RepID=A0A2U1NMP1_ARTAN|nr:NB-ARC domains-containing protein [Artemisia annua]